VREAVVDGCRLDEYTRTSACARNLERTPSLMPNPRFVKWRTTKPSMQAKARSAGMSSGRRRAAIGAEYAIGSRDSSPSTNTMAAIAAKEGGPELVRARSSGSDEWDHARRYMTNADETARCRVDQAGRTSGSLRTRRNSGRNQGCRPKQDEGPERHYTPQTRGPRR